MARGLGIVAPPPPGAPPAAPPPAGAPPGLPPLGAPPAAPTAASLPGLGSVKQNPDGSFTVLSGPMAGSIVEQTPGGIVQRNPDGTGKMLTGPHVGTDLAPSSNGWLDKATGAVLAPAVGGVTAAADTASGKFGKVPGDIAYGSTAGIVGNGPGSPTSAPVNPQSIDLAGKAVGKLPGEAGAAAGDAATAVGNAIGGIGAGAGSGAPTPAADPGADFRQQQLDYAKQLQATINGTAGPSAADIQGHNAQDRAIAQQFAAAQGATGANSGMAYRQALQNAAGISQQAGADAATQRAKEVQDAQGQYNALLTGARGADLTKYGTDVGAGNVRYAADKDFEGKKIAAGAGFLSGVFSPTNPVSDERKKTAIASGDDEIAAMLDKLKAHKFQYKDPGEPGAAPGKRAGVMAQDLEKSMAGRALVVEAPDGTKGIDSPQAVGAMLAALASLHARTKRLEGRG